MKLGESVPWQLHGPPACAWTPRLSHALLERRESDVAHLPLDAQDLSLAHCRACSEPAPDLSATPLFEDFVPRAVPVPTDPIDTPHPGFTVESGHTSLLGAGVRTSPVTVRGNATLRLIGGGLFVFEDLQLESGSRLEVQPPGIPPSPATWIYIKSSQNVILRGSIVPAPAAGPPPVPGSPAKIFFGVPNAATVHLGPAFAGTLVAPNAHVEVPGGGNFSFAGSIFAGNIVIHQERTIVHVPFPHPWVPKCVNEVSCQ